MANTSIKILRSGVSGRIPELSKLEHGVLALNYADGILYYRNTANTISYIKNSDSFSTINANGNLVLAGSSSDILNLVSGNIDISVSDKTINFDVKVSDLINNNSNIASTDSVHYVNNKIDLHIEDLSIHNTIISINNANNTIMVDTFLGNEYRTVEYSIQAKNANTVHVSKIILTHNDIDLFYVEPYELLSGADRLYNFDAIFNLNSVEVYLDVVSSTKLKISKNIIPA